MNEIHFSDWSQQPSVRIYCTQTYSTPAWNKIMPMEKILRIGVHLLDNDEYYSFDKKKVNCKNCIDRLAKEDEEAYAYIG